MAARGATEGREAKVRALGAAARTARGAEASQLNSSQSSLNVGCILLHSGPGKIKNPTKPVRSGPSVAGWLARLSVTETSLDAELRNISISQCPQTSSTKTFVSNTTKPKRNAKSRENDTISTPKTDFSQARAEQLNRAACRYSPRISAVRTAATRPDWILERSMAFCGVREVVVRFSTTSRFCVFFSASEIFPDISIGPARHSEDWLAVVAGWPGWVPVPGCSSFQSR